MAGAWWALPAAGAETAPDTLPLPAVAGAPACTPPLPAAPEPKPMPAPEAMPLMTMSATMIQSVLRMPIWWLIQPSTGGPHKKAT